MNGIAADYGGIRSVHFARTGIYYAVLVVLGLASSTVGPTLPALAEKTQVQLSSMGLLFTARSFGYLIGSFQGGRLYDIVQGHRLMTGLLASMLVLLAAIPSMPALWMLLVVVLFLGLTEGAIDVGANTLLVWTHGERVGPYMNGLHFFWGVGAFVAPVLVTQIAQRASLETAYWALALIALPIVFVLPRVSCPESNPTSDLRGMRTAGGWLIAILALLTFLYIGTEVTLGGWIYTYAVSSGLAGASSAAYLTSAFWGALTLGRLLAVPIATKLRPGVILLVDLCGALLSAVAVLNWSHSLAILWIGCLGMGLALASVFPTIMSFAERRIVLTGRLTSWLFVGGSAGGMTVPWLVGYFFESNGPQFTLQVIAVDLLMAIITLIVVIIVSRRMVSHDAKSV
ncbi:MAG: MFS transporter [Chloroflexi bacterium]|nr:MFS transporter [Chloroflexota bacterium]